MELRKVHKSDDIGIMLQKTQMKDVIEESEDCIIIYLKKDAKGKNDINAVAMLQHPADTLDMLSCMDDIQQELLIGTSASMLSEAYKAKLEGEKTLEELAKDLYKHYPHKKRFAEVYTRAKKMLEEEGEL